MYITEKIEQIMVQIESKCSDLFAITYKEVLPIKSTNKGYLYYGQMYSKPTKRLSRLLTIEKEVLIFISTFTEQQQRTVKSVRSLIEKSQGRLEQSIAIVVHCDSSANYKLKKWGRENSITILPICITDEFPNGEKLESTLLSELFAYDPFDITGPVSDDAQFYGRRTEAIELARKLIAGQIRSYLGIRKIGKTSILNRCLKETIKLGPCRCFLIDCSKDSIWQMSAAQLMAALAEGISLSNITHDSQIIIKPAYKDISIEESISIVLEEIDKSDDAIILFFDEIDYITPSSPTGSHWMQEFNIFWRNFRAVYQDITRKRHNLGVFISGVSSKWFMVESINGIENAALALIPEEYLLPMARGASEKMVQTLARTSGLSFDSQCASYISEYCSDYPYWVRKACSFIHRNIPLSQRPCSVPFETTKKLLEDFLTHEGGVLSRVAITHLMGVYPELQEPAIKCYKGKFGDCSTVYLNILEKYGIINSRTKTISGVLMQEGLKLFEELNTSSTIANTKVSDKENQNDLISPKIKFENYTEWADELAILNRDRNVLERQLRAIVVNFIRQDSLNNKNKGTTSERILKIIDSERRKDFNQLLPEQIIDKFNWLQLCSLIEKEWQIFECIFNDKTQFKLNYLNINDRLDAHAKEADLADVALQRKSLKWLQDKLRVL